MPKSLEAVSLLQPKAGQSQPSALASPGGERGWGCMWGVLWGAGAEGAAGKRGCPRGPEHCSAEGAGGWGLGGRGWSPLCHTSLASSAPAGETMDPWSWWCQQQRGVLCPSQPVACPCLALIFPASLLHDQWSLWVSMQCTSAWVCSASHGLSSSLILGKPLPGTAGSKRRVVGADLLFLAGFLCCLLLARSPPQGGGWWESSTLSFPLRLGRAGGWAGTQADRCIRLPGTGEQPRARCSWGAWGRHSPGSSASTSRSPRCWGSTCWAPKLHKDGGGVGLSCAGAKQGCPPPAAMFSGALLCLRKLTLAGATVYSLGSFQGAAEKMPAERERGSLCSRPARAWNNAARKNILSIYTACPPRMQAWTN